MFAWQFFELYVLHGSWRCTLSLKGLGVQERGAQFGGLRMEAADS